MTVEQEVLFKLIRIALGNESCGSLPLSVDWKKVIDLSFEQGVAAIAVDGLQRIYDEIPNQVRADEAQVRNDALEQLDSPSLEGLKYEWFGSVMSGEQDYELHCTRAAELTRIFADAGMRSCILKGVGNSQMYPEPGHRACGDIDIWVEGGRERVLEFLRGHYKVGKAIVHHADVEIFSDVMTEVHYMPNWFYNFRKNRVLQSYFASMQDSLFDNIDPELGFAYPPLKFNAVYLLIHTFRHVFSKGVPLKQIVDYYVVMANEKLTASERKECFEVIKDLGLQSFAAAMMYVMQKAFGLEERLLLCEPDVKRGKKLMEDIMSEQKVKSDADLIGKGKRIIKYSLDYPSEALSAPIWKIWHFVFRKKISSHNSEN